MNPVFLIGSFGVLGVLARYGLDRTLGSWNGSFPVSTLVVNLLGCLFAGVVVGLSERSALSSPLQLGLIVGFCGGFTTFSAYALQSVMMMERERVWVALGYLVLSPVFGFAMLFGALMLTRRWSAA